jgi:hypothetical protein
MIGRLAGVGVIVAAGAGARAASAGDREFFEKKIRPLLVERCYECHSEGKKIKAGLRLNHAAGWLQGGDSGPAVVPGKVDESPLIKAVRYSGLEFEAMPPKTQLPREEVALLEEWIKQGAPAPEEEARVAMAASAGRKSGLSVEEGRRFWSMIPPADVSVPPAASNWPRTAIDRLVAAGWGSKGLRPAPDAARAALLRRVTFDLTGLPPSPAALEAFERDARPTAEAFAAVVDAMLASPQFGERWGRRWLDVARFAESSGGGRTLMFKDAWRYRDYVVEAVNSDLPFDRFIREQIAGDLLPAADVEARRRQLTATSFLALGPTNYEEQNKDQLRMDIVDEQIDTIGKAFLGLALGCARCHDHKFDPVPTRDYYALAGILRGTHTLENYTDNVARWVEAEVAAHRRGGGRSCRAPPRDRRAGKEDRGASEGDGPGRHRQRGRLGVLARRGAGRPAGENRRRTECLDHGEAVSGRRLPDRQQRAKGPARRHLHACDSAGRSLRGAFRFYRSAQPRHERPDHHPPRRWRKHRGGE